MESITSLHNPKIKLAIRLREARQRKKTGLTLIDGIREVYHALHSEVEFETLFVSESAVQTGTQEVRDILEKGEAKAGIVVVPDGLMERISFGDRNSHVLAVARTPSRELGRLTLPTHPLVVVLDRFEKPGNLGALLRTANGAGVHAVILSSPICELYNPNAIRASQGAIFQVPIGVGEFQDVFEWLLQHRFAIYAAIPSATAYYCSMDFRQPTALVLGNEAQGLGAEWHHHPVQPIALPMAGSMDSLNVSVCGGILMYEAWRQRHSDSEFHGLKHVSNLSHREEA